MLKANINVAIRW